MLKFWQYSLLITIFIVCFSKSARSQIILDNTLGNESTQIKNNVIIKGIPSTEINGGAVRGGNLFHSFQEFNIQQGRGAYFANPIGINNIFTRITGNNISNINGTLGVLGNANLFFMNPNGIIFGEGARLDLNGSFFATTGNTFNFGNGIEFSTINPENIPRITNNFVPGLGFGSEMQINLDRNSGQIIVLGEGHNLRVTPFSPVQEEIPSAGLEVNKGQTLGLIGNGLNLEKAVIRAKSGNIELGSASDSIVTIGLNNSNNNFNLNYNSGSVFEDIKISNISLIDSSSSRNDINSGVINLQGKNISFSSGSTALVQNLGNFNGNSLNINASEALTIEGTDPLVTGEGTGRINSSLRVENLGSGQMGDIKIIAKNISLQEGGQINNFIFSSGSGGNISITSSGKVELIGASLIAPEAYLSSILTLSFNSGNSGDVLINAKNINLLNGGAISSGTFSSAPGGDLIINSSESIKLSGIQPENGTSSGIGSSTWGTLGNGKGGTITVNSPIVLIEKGGTISSSTFSIGDSGNITINAEKVKIIGTGESQQSSGILASAIMLPEITRTIFNVPKNLSGNAGNIEINTLKLEIVNGGLVGSFNDGTGNAGNVNLNVDNLNLDRNGTLSTTSFSRVGGRINISGLQPNSSANIISLNNNSNIQTNNSTTSDPSRASIDINTHDLIVNNGSTISANVNDSPENPLDPNLNLVGGNIKIRTTGDIQILNNSSIAAEVNNRPGGAIDGGNINIEAQGSIKIANNISPRAAISASVTEFGDGGNIKITLPNGILVGVNDADIRATAVNGNGGDIFIEAFTILTTSDMNATDLIERSQPVKSLQIMI